MDFSSDTAAPAHPSLFDALRAANDGQAPGYGADAITASVEQALRERFEVDLRIWLVSSGTAANCLALSVLCSPCGAILCHAEAHIECDERGAPEFFTGGGKLHLLPGAAGKIDLEALDAALLLQRPDFFHATPFEVLSLTNLTENGTAYTATELAERCDRARSIGCTVHLDGARFANALVSPANAGATPADLSWRAGVDILSLGFTKSGAMACEAIVVFDPEQVRGASRSARRATLTARFEELRVRAKRSGHVPAKLRYLAAQADAMLAQDLWLELARTANARAQSLAEQLLGLPGVTLHAPVDGNEVLAYLPAEIERRLTEAGAKFYPWTEGSRRFVCSWATTQAEIQGVGALA